MKLLDTTLKTLMGLESDLEEHQHLPLSIYKDIKLLGTWRVLLKCVIKKV